MNNDPIGITGNFGNLAGDYERGRREYPLALLECVLRHIENAPASLLLDVGCGTGKATRLLASRVGMIIGADPDPQCLHAALQQAGSNLAYRLASAEALPFRDQTFDAVTTFSSFHWWCRQPGALASIQRVLRGGGSFFVVNKHDTGPFRQQARAIISRYSLHQLTDAKEGYDPVSLLQAERRWDVTCQELVHEEQFTLSELICQIRSLAVWNCIPDSRRAAATWALEAHFSTQLEEDLFRRPLLMRVVIARKQG